MSRNAQKQKERAEAIENLRAILKPGQTVYAILRHRSASGMSRTIDLAIIGTRVDSVYPMRADGSRDYDAEPKKKRSQYVRCIGHLAAQALGWQFDRDRGGVKVDGCGMDMGFHLVYSLGYALWPNGTKKPHGRRNGEPDHAGGYALKCDWL